MADAPQPSIDTKETDKKMRKRADKFIRRATSESSGSITLDTKSLEYTVSAAFLPVVSYLGPAIAGIITGRRSGAVIFQN